MNYNDYLKLASNKSKKSILVNLYGNIASPDCNYYNPINANKITQTGKLIMQKLEVEINELLLKDEFILNTLKPFLCNDEKSEVIFAFTDSFFISFKNYKFNNNLKNNIKDYLEIKINEITNNIVKELGGDENIIKIKYVNTYKRGFWINKTSYILDKKLKGWISEQQNIPYYFRQKIHLLTEGILNDWKENEIYKFLNKVKDEIKMIDTQMLSIPLKIKDLYKTDNNIELNLAREYNEFALKNNLNLIKNNSYCRLIKLNKDKIIAYIDFQFPSKHFSINYNFLIKTYLIDMFLLKILNKLNLKMSFDFF